MPIPFSLILEHIRISIVQKLNIQDFVHFHACSRASYKLAPKTNYKTCTKSWKIKKYIQNKKAFRVLCFTLNGKGYMLSIKRAFDAPIQNIDDDVHCSTPLTEEICKWLTDFIQKSKSTPRSLAVTELNCSPDSFNKLLEVSQVEALTSYNKTMSAAHLAVPAIKNLNRFTVIAPSIDDDYLLTLKMSHLILHKTSITSFGINRLLKEWLNGARMISKIFIISDLQFAHKAIFDGIYHFLGVSSDSDFSVSYMKNTSDHWITVTITTDVFNRRWVVIECK